MLTRRNFLQAAGGATGAFITGARAQPAGSDPITVIQNRIDNYAGMTRRDRNANIAVVLGVVMPEEPARGGRILYAGRSGLTNPNGAPLDLDEHTPFAIGSTSKVFTSGIHYMLHGPYEGTLGTWLGRRLTMSQAVAGISLKDLAIYEPGLPQDNRGGVYPRPMMASLANLFDYMATFTPPDPPGTCYAYSNVGWALLSMAALKLDSTDTRAFARAYNTQLAQFCRRFSASETQVFRFDLKPRLPMGYTRQFVPLPPTSSYQPARAPGYGSGGIISTAADMMQFLLYNMGRLPGGLTDPALAYQQTQTFHTPPCSGNGAGPVTSYGWFHQRIETPHGAATVLNKNGGVAGFTSWMGFASWQGAGTPSPCGVFVLSNGPSSTVIGTRAMRLLLGA